MNGQPDNKKDTLSNKAFDKHLFFANTRYLLKQTDLKLGELERKAGREPGYMARLEKAGNTTDPTIEFVATVSEELGVSIDYLTRLSLTEITPDDDYKLRFLEKLKTDTFSGKLTWHKEKREELQGLLGYDKFAPAHKLLEYQDKERKTVVLVSDTFGSNTQFAGDCYFTEIKGKELYLMNMMNYPYTSDDKYQYVMEIWITEGLFSKDFICGTNELPSIAEEIKDIYDIISEKLKKPTLNKNVMEFVDSFLND